jgi:hypothetical protein
MTYEEQSAEEKRSRITVGRLIEKLSVYPKDAEITFGSLMDATLLVFYRVKRRGDDLVQI